MTQEQAEESRLSESQFNEVTRLKAYFPFRICYGAISPDGAFVSGAVATMRQPNMLARRGWRVYITH